MLMRVTNQFVLFRRIIDTNIIHISRVVLQCAKYRKRLSGIEHIQNAHKIHAIKFACITYTYLQAGNFVNCFWSDVICTIRKVVIGNFF